ncbi:ATP-binding protein [Streptomyces sp. AP-93]|uniref:ATP-binding protein n=1 Tax=Streptomyces sp. AP-93 TaxID=2929048 RepID=UPI001FAEB4CD|nr:ATP-binding protein [Streptomyces sp. AP-93]MCJ0875237.1 ATP-binding protein [Streptomyces sp. AP-93]
MARAGSTGGGFGAGAAHLRAEWGRWWRTEDWTDTHVAHYVLNDQFRTWQRFQQRNRAEVQQNIGLLKEQQKYARQAQIMQINRERTRHRQGRSGGGMYGGGGGASPMISYKMMQWASLQMRMGQQEFRHLEITPSQLHIGRGHVRSHRHKAAAAWILGLGAAWVGLWWASVTTALVLVLLAAAVFAIAAASAGRGLKPRRPPVPKLLFIPPNVPAHTELAADPEPQPFPIREAGRDPRQAREAVRLALLKEKARVAEVHVPEETAYGWNVPVVLESGTAGQLIGTLKNVATTLRVGTSRVLARAVDPNDAALVNIQILTRDPFANPPAYPVRAPRSCSITDPFSIGVSIDGEHTPIVLAGQSALIVARTGGGKSAMVRALADYASACFDAVVVDIDPMGRGLGPLASVAVRSALTRQDAEDELAYLKALAEARIAALGPTEDNMTVSSATPAVIAFVDEFPELSDRGKATAIELLRVARKSRVTLVICTTDATTDVMGDAIGDALGIRILMSCRQADVPLVVGQNDAVAKGWLPHLLVPSPGEWEIADAGQYYCITPRHREPILRYVSHLTADVAVQRARERVAAGLPVLSWPAVNGPATQATTKPLARIVEQILTAFATQSNPAAMSVEQITEHLATVDPAVWRQWDGRERRDRLAAAGRRIKTELKAAGITITSQRIDELPGRPTGYRLTDIRDALS